MSGRAPGEVAGGDHEVQNAGRVPGRELDGGAGAGRDRDDVDRFEPLMIKRRSERVGLEGASGVGWQRASEIAETRWSDDSLDRGEVLHRRERTVEAVEDAMADQERITSTHLFVLLRSEVRLVNRPVEGGKVAPRHL